MQTKVTVAAEAKLDHQQLLGFRNLVEVRTAGDDLDESSDLAFQRRGTELPKSGAEN